MGCLMLQRDNALNLVRLALVLAVVLSHSFVVGRYGASPLILGNTPGQWGLAGLFTASGYLIARGAIDGGYVEFMVRRIARLWPAYLACLAVVVAVFAPISYIVMNGSLDGFFGAELGPFRFLSQNVLFELRQSRISGTPDQYGWSGNLWTVFYTLLSYAIVGLALRLPSPALRLAAVAIVFAVSIAAYANIDAAMPYLQDGRVALLLRFLPFFSGGAVLYLLRERIPVRWWVAALALGVIVVAAALQPSWGLQLAAPLIAYVVVALANVTGLPSFLRDNDFAMGYFMYSFPVQKVLNLLGAGELAGNPWTYFGLSVVATTPFAVASWFLIERPAIRANRRARAATATPAAA
jgi:peptidoglycan/LPS O-acetylase OafA/YrhL